MEFDGLADGSRKGSTGSGTNNSDGPLADGPDYSGGGLMIQGTSTSIINKGAGGGVGLHQQQQHQQPRNPLVASASTGWDLGGPPGLIANSSLATAALNGGLASFSVLNVEGNSVLAGVGAVMTHPPIDRPDLVEAMLRRLVALPLSPYLGTPRDAEKLEGIIENIEELVLFFFTALEHSVVQPHRANEAMAAMAFSLLEESLSIFETLPLGSVYCCGERDDVLLELLQYLATCWRKLSVSVDAETLSVRSVVASRCADLMDHIQNTYLFDEDDGASGRVAPPPPGGGSGGDGGGDLNKTASRSRSGSRSGSGVGTGGGSGGKVTISIRFPWASRMGRACSIHGSRAQLAVVGMTILFVAALGVLSVFTALETRNMSGAAALWSTSCPTDGSVGYRNDDNGDSSIVTTETYVLVVRTAMILFSLLAVGATVTLSKLWVWQSRCLLRSFEINERNASLGLYTPPSLWSAAQQQQQQQQQQQHPSQNTDSPPTIKLEVNDPAGPLSRSGETLPGPPLPGGDNSSSAVGALFSVIGVGSRLGGNGGSIRADDEDSIHHEVTPASALAEANDANLESKNSNNSPNNRMVSPPLASRKHAQHGGEDSPSSKGRGTRRLVDERSILDGMYQPNPNAADHHRPQQPGNPFAGTSSTFDELRSTGSKETNSAGGSLGNLPAVGQVPAVLDYRASLSTEHLPAEQQQQNDSLLKLVLRETVPPLSPTINTSATIHQLAGYNASGSGGASGNPQALSGVQKTEAIGGIATAAGASTSVSSSQTPSMSSYTSLLPPPVGILKSSSLPLLVADASVSGDPSTSFGSGGSGSGGAGAGVGTTTGGTTRGTPTSARLPSKKAPVVATGTVVKTNSTTPRSAGMKEASHRGRGDPSSTVGGGDEDGGKSKLLLPLERVNGTFLLASTRAACEYIIAVGYDRKGKILLWNSAASSGSGHSSNNVIGKNIDTFLDIDDPHGCRRTVHCTMYTKTGTYNLRGTISSLYSEGNPKKIGHVFLAPNRSSEALRFVHNYRREQTNELIYRLKEGEGDLFEQHQTIAMLEKVSRLMEWSSVIDLSESIEREWTPVTRGQLLAQLKKVSQFIEITETVPERFSIDLKLLMSVIAEVAGARRAKIKVEGAEFGTEFMSLNFVLVTAGGGYPFHTEDIEDHLGLELGRLGCHISTGEDQTRLTLQVPTVVNLHLEDDEGGQRKQPMVATMWGATDDAMARNFATAVTQHVEADVSTAQPNFTLRVLHRSDLLLPALKSTHCMVTTPQALEFLRSVLHEVQMASYAQNISFDPPILCVLVPSATGVDAATATIEVRPGEVKVSYPFEETDLKRLLTTIRGKWSTLVLEPLWVQGPLLGRGAVGTVYEAILGTPDAETGSAPAVGGGGAHNYVSSGGLSLAIKHIQKERRQLPGGAGADPNENSNSANAAMLAAERGSSGSGAAAAVIDVGNGSAAMVAEWKEVELMRKMNHPNIVAFYFAEESVDRFSMALELCEGSISEVAIPAAELPSIIRQIVSGVTYIHSKNIVHRDLKPGNVLVTRGNVVKLSDFGVAEVDDRVDSALKEMAGTYRFMAPEVFQGAVATTASDIWAIGCIVCELLDALPLFMKKRQHMRLLNLTSVELPRKIVDPLTRDFLNACFQVDPAQRATAEKLLTLPYLAPLSFPTTGGMSPTSSTHHSRPHPSHLVGGGSVPTAKVAECSMSAESIASGASAFTMDSDD